MELFKLKKSKSFMDGARSWPDYIIFSFGVILQNCLGKPRSPLSDLLIRE